MAEDQTSTAPAAQAGTSPQAGTNGVVDMQPTAPQSGQVPAATPTVAELQAQIERERAERQAANKEAQQMRAKLKALEDAEAKRTEATLSEQEKAIKRAEAAEARAQELEARHREITVRSAVQAAATQAGIIDPDAAYRLIDAGKITIDDSGNVNGVTEAVKALVESKPYLIGQSGGSGATNQQRGGAGVDWETRARDTLAGGMSRGIFDPERIKESGGGVTMPR